MRILLDECITKGLKPYLTLHEVSTVAEQGWSGFQNGRLMTVTEAAGFDILLTIDKNSKHQQDSGKYSLIVAVLDSPSSKLETLIQYLPAFEQHLMSYTKGNAYSIRL